MRDCALDRADSEREFEELVRDLELDLDPVPDRDLEPFARR